MIGFDRRVFPALAPLHSGIPFGPAPFGPAPFGPAAAPRHPNTQAQSRRHSGGFHAVRRSLFSDIFIPTKSGNIFHPRKNVCGANTLSPSSHVGNCIRLRHVAGALGPRLCVLHSLFKSKLLSGGPRGLGQQGWGSGG